MGGGSSRLSERFDWVVQVPSSICKKKSRCPYTCVEQEDRQRSACTCKYPADWIRPYNSHEIVTRSTILLSGTMIKFSLLDFLRVSHKIPGKNKHAIYPLQISALAADIFKLEKCVKCATEMTDNVIHSIQYYIKYILANFQRRPLKLSMC